MRRVLLSIEHCSLPLGSQEPLTKHKLWISMDLVIRQAESLTEELLHEEIKH